MKNILKKLGISSYVSLGVVVLALVSLIIYIINSNLAYFRNLNSLVIVCTIIGIILVIAPAVAAHFIGEKWFFIVAQVAAGALLTFALMTSISDRSAAMGYVWFSNLEASNGTAVAALNQSVVFWVTYILSIAGVVVSGFNNYLKTEK